MLSIKNFVCDDFENHTSSLNGWIKNINYKWFHTHLFMDAWKYDTTLNNGAYKLKLRGIARDELTQCYAGEKIVQAIVSTGLAYDDVICTTVKKKIVVLSCSENMYGPSWAVFDYNQFDRFDVLALECLLAPLKSRIIRQNVLRGSKIGKRGFCPPWAAAATASFMRLAAIKGLNPTSVWRSQEGLSRCYNPGYELRYQWHKFGNLFSNPTGFQDLECNFEGFWIKIFGQITPDINIQQDAGTRFLIYKNIPDVILNALSGRKFGDVFLLEDPDIRYAFADLKIISAENCDEHAWETAHVIVYVEDPVVTLAPTPRKVIARSGVANLCQSASMRPWWLT